MGLIKNAVFTAKKYSPEIKFVFAVISFGAALYTTHKSALKAQRIIEKRKEWLGTVEEVKKQVENGEIPEEEYSEKDRKKDVLVTNLEFGIDMVKNYALPAGFSALSVWLFRGAMLDYKNLALGLNAAYNTLLMKYNSEMGHFKKELGEEKFNDIQESYAAETIIQSQLSGIKNPKQKAEIMEKATDFSRLFDETNPLWTGNPSTDLFTLRCKEAELDEILQREGYIKYNDMLVRTGNREVKAGEILGILRDNPDGTINHVSFGLFNVHDDTKAWFEPGYEPIYLIRFNLDPKPIISRLNWPDI